MPSRLRVYAQSDGLQTEGACFLRPYMLNFRSDLGLKGYIEPVGSSHIVGKSSILFAKCVESFSEV